MSTVNNTRPRFDINLLPRNMREKVLPGTNGCWDWLGALNSSGYGSMTNGRGSSKLTHRAAYELLVGTIPRPLTIDHLCFNKVCVNTDHMEVVTRSENSKRKLSAQTHCKSGHPLSGENLYLRPRKNGLVYRVCRTCQLRWQKNWYQKKVVRDLTPGVA